jgi:Uncharacterized conserved protein
MTDTIQRELWFPQSRQEVWNAIAQSSTLAEWMYPNDFEPRVGHRFTFRVPPNPAVNFEGLTVHCEVLECEPPRRLVFSWTVGGPVTDTRVRFELSEENGGTRLAFEHSGFDLSRPFGEEAFKGAQYGWATMLEKLASVVSRSPDL